MERTIGVYKYVYHGRVIYIGKSDRSIEQRIKGHSKESKFKPYLEGSEIYYHLLSNPAQTTVYETVLINKYKPKLNSAMKYRESIGVTLPDIEWKPFCEMGLEVLMKALDSKIEKNPFKIKTVDYEKCVCGTLGNRFIEVSGLAGGQIIVYLWQKNPVIQCFCQIYCKSINDAFRVCLKLYDTYCKNAKGERTEMQYGSLFNEARQNYVYEYNRGELVEAQP